METSPATNQRYRIHNGKIVIEIRVRSVLQLFDARDPAPFRARDLDDDFTEYVVASVDELPVNLPLQILIYVEGPEIKELGPDAIREAIQTYFNYQIDLKRLQLSKIFKTARLFFAIGLCVLVGCLIFIRALDKAFPPESYPPIFREGFVIFGWVSMWKPFELVLFDWYPVYDRIRLFRKLLAAEIEVRFSH